MSEIRSNRLLTVDEVAAQLQVHPQTVRLYIRRGLLGFVQLGPKRALRVREDQLAHFIEDHTIYVD